MASSTFADRATGRGWAEVDRHLTAAMVGGDTLLRETKRYQLAIERGILGGDETDGREWFPY